ncbi:hypothetical protein [Streptomyces sp. NPDC000410]|uniref:hypothetical protein n=1 Tax=Streptomyces sp. NPDC000410 TaxID=3154254 RepID=UPI00332D357E
MSGRAVLYVCTIPSDASAEIVQGRLFAERHRLLIGAEVTDNPHADETDPLHRVGWNRVRAMVQANWADVVIIPQPGHLAPESRHELRYRETRWLLEQKARVFYTAGVRSGVVAR